MKIISFTYVLFFLNTLLMLKPSVQEFQGQAIYFSKSSLELGSFGARMNEAQKKQIQDNLKNRLEKSYILNFNKEESFFKEEDKLDAISGATDSWGKNFSRGEQYKNVKKNELVQSQEFYGKRFLVKDKLQKIEWIMGTESKKIGQYMCFKATALVPTTELTWFDFSWNNLTPNTETNVDSSNDQNKDVEIKMTKIEAWYTPQIPVAHGPAEYWGLPGLILEVSAGNTIMLCSKIVLNPQQIIKIETPDKGKIVNKNEYQSIISEKMIEMRDNRRR